MAKQHFTPNDLINEEWCDIPGYEGLYQVSNCGRVKSFDCITHNQYSTYIKRGRILSLHLDSKGYYQARLTKGGKIQGFGVHRLVLSAFDRLPEQNEVCNHKDCCPTNNRLENLEWVTHDENMKYAARLGRITAKRGEDSPRSKLTNATAQQIREEYRRGVSGHGARVLAAKYGVSRAAIRHILNRKTYND